MMQNTKYGASKTVHLAIDDGENAALKRSGYGRQRPIFESDADMEGYYRVWDDDETTTYRTF